MKMTLKTAIQKIDPHYAIFIYLNGDYAICEFNKAYKDFVDKFSDSRVYAIEYLYLGGYINCVNIKIVEKYK